MAHRKTLGHRSPASWRDGSSMEGMGAGSGPREGGPRCTVGPFGEAARKP